VEGIQRHFNASTATVICPWGEKGVAGRIGLQGDMIEVEAFRPEELVDTLAAGDCFIGASVALLNEGIMRLEEVLTKASRVAGKKCGQKGLLNLDVE